MSQTADASPTRRSRLEWVTLAARLVLGATLLAAGALKIGALEASVQSVRLYQLLPFETTAFVGYALPIIEIAVGVLLITGTFTRVSAIVGSLLMLAFIIGIASVWARGISIDCGCFGGGGEVDPSQTRYPEEIARDTGLLLAGLWTAWRPRSPWAVDNWLFRPVDLPDIDETTDDETTVTDKEPAR